MIEAQRIKWQDLLGNQDVGGGASAAATADVSGADYATILVSYAAEVNTSAVGPTISLQHADVTDATSFATMVANVTEDLSSATHRVYHVDLRGKKKYIRLLVTPGTHTTNDDITVAAALGLSRNREDPAATTEIGDNVTIVS